MAVASGPDDAGLMQGTIVCGVTAAPEARAAAQLADALAARLGLRLVLAHVAAGHRDDPDAQARLEALADDLGSGPELRLVHGSRVDALARVAADEGADVIVLGSQPHGARGRRLRCSLARQLEAVQAVPVLIAPPATRDRSGSRLRLAETSAQR